MFSIYSLQILFAVALPLLVVWPYTRGRLFEKKKTEEDRKGEMNMHLNPDELRIAMFQLFVQYMVFHAIQVRVPQGSILGPFMSQPYSKHFINVAASLYLIIKFSHTTAHI